MVIDDSKDVVVLGFCDGFIQYNFDMKIIANNIDKSYKYVNN